MRDFQYRLLVNSIYVNDRLFHWKLVETQKCEHCEHKQTILHLLWECEHAQKIWADLNRYLKDYTLIEIDEVTISPKTIFLNNVHSIPGHIANLFVLIIKQSMFAAKCLGEKLTFQSIVNQIELYYQSERYYAYMNGKQAKHVKKWNLYNIDVNPRPETKQKNQFELNEYANEYVAGLNFLRDNSN